MNIESSISIIKHTHEFVDLYKIGRANYLKGITKNTDWKRYTLQILELVNKLKIKHYIKKDLQGYLPTNYHNPKYIMQYH